jgi:hypothetical protein
LAGSCPNGMAFADVDYNVSRSIIHEVD